LIELCLDAAIENVAAFFIDDGVGQPEFWNLTAHHAAGRLAIVQDRDVIAKCGEIARNGQRGGAGPDAGNVLVVFVGWLRRQLIANITLEICGDALQPADRDRILFDTATPARRFAGAIADAAEDSRKYVASPVEQICIGVTLGSDQTDVLRDRGMCGARPLAIDDLVKIVGDNDIGGLQIRSARIG